MFNMFILIHKNVQYEITFTEIIRLDLKLGFENVPKIGQKHGIDFDELPRIIPEFIFSIFQFPSSFISFKSVCIFSGTFDNN